MINDCPKPDRRWLSNLESWLRDTQRILLVYTLAGRAGSGGYYIGESAERIDSFVSKLPIATRIFAYRDCQILMTGIVDEEFAAQVSKNIPPEGDFLILRLEKSPHSFGYEGFLGDSIEELDEILRDLEGDTVAFGLSPGPDSKRLEAYVGGERGAY